jgi:glutathione synthase/RimK-type ligase-like ATP-grasp enzyme
MTLLGVYREKVFSPGKVREDAAILDATLQALSRMGHTFHTLEAEALGRLAIDFNTHGSTPAGTRHSRGNLCILTMAQSGRALKVLEAERKRGARIINSIASVRNCYRRPLVRLLEEAGLPIPRSEIVATEEAEDRVSFQGADSYWLKRGDVHAMEAGDVKRVGSSEELTAALSHFKERKIGEILVQEHVEGDVIKFYGAGTETYFSAFLASTGEEITSVAGQLRRLAHQAAQAIGLEIYGGDAVVTSKRDVLLIDFNDWPSFSRCRESAAHNIAGYIAGII